MIAVLTDDNQIDAGLIKIISDSPAFSIGSNIVIKQVMTVKHVKYIILLFGAVVAFGQIYPDLSRILGKR